jgi:hypothetical protein
MTLSRLLGHLVLLAILPMVPAAGGETVPSSAAVPSSQRPELERLLAGHEVRELEFERAVEEMIKAAGKNYTTRLEEARTKAFRGKRVDLAESLGREITRFNEEFLNGQPGRPHPAEIRSAWADFTYDCVLARRSVAPKRQALRAQLAEGLDGLEERYRSAADAVGLALVKRAKTCLAIRRAIESDRMSMTEILGDGQREGRDVVKEGGYLVGFELAERHGYLGCWRPIFATASGIRDGNRRGIESGTRVVAKEGYAVGGMWVKRGNFIDSVQIIFMRIKPDGLSLDSKDFYVSESFGGNGGGKAEELTSNGRLIVGVAGYAGHYIGGVGFLHLK